MLVDAGGEWDYFTGDITRTWPANGKFSARQRDVYQVVLAANEACIAKAKPGATLHGLHDVALVVLSQGLLDLGLVKRSLEEVLENQLYKPSYIHRTNHWLGIDVHDVGSYCVDKIPRKLESGMVITVEPALYLDLNRDDLPEEFRGIGIRIEDDVLITADTPEVLSAGVPKQIQDIEAIVGTSVR